MHRLTIWVLAVGLALTALLTWTSRSQYQHNERRLLSLRVKEAGSAISGALPAIQTPLASAVTLADATKGDVSQFEQFVSAYAGPGRPFASVSLWAPGKADSPVSVVGEPPELAVSGQASALFDRAERGKTLSVTGLLGPALRLGYAFATPGSVRGYIVYAESALPANRRTSINRGAAFADLNFALYIGRSEQSGDLLEANVAHPPIQGRRESAVVPFGDSALTLVMSPQQPLSGRLAATLPWILVGAGVALSAALATMTERLIRRRRQAEALAERLRAREAETARLYGEQRTVAETLQLALLPQLPPVTSGIEAAVRYRPGVQGIHIGGDWYDLIPLADGNAMLIVGDVSGRGLGAATVMASLLFSARAYAAQGDSPDAIIAKLSELIDVEQSDHFATVLCVHLDASRRAVTVANAGHPPPLVLDESGGHFLDGPVDRPVGVARPAGTVKELVRPTVTALPAGATLLAFTDGLIERRNEDLAEGLERLRGAAEAHRAEPLGKVLDAVVSELIGQGADDDTVLVGVRWRT